MRIRILAAAALLASCLPPIAFAQTNDGFSASQLIPVVVDSGSFVQRFVLQNKNSADFDVEAYYYPGQGTTQAATGTLACGTFTLAAGKEKVFSSLRAICPTLGAGSQFGMLLFRRNGFETFSAYSRVSNLQGAGFSVEAFPASVFNSQTAVVTGLRRLAATASTPAYQTNCFAGVPGPLLNTHGTPLAVHYVMRDAQGAQIGSGDLDLPDGILIRLLDVFAAAGVPAGNQDDASIEFTGARAQGMVAFCTVQDNTSFGADFRIAKTASALVSGSLGPNVGAYDTFLQRDIFMSSDVLGRQFRIPAGAYVNTHLFTAHRPDIIRCDLVDGTGQTLDPSYGLEMRVLLEAGGHWGGNDSVTVPDVAKFDLPYQGDKDTAPANAQFILQVESNGQNEGAIRAYRLRCRSGSGMSPPQIIEYQRAGTDF